MSKNNVTVEESTRNALKGYSSLFFTFTLERSVAIRTYLLFLVVAVLGSALAAPAAAEDATANKLVGTWKIVSAKYGGQQSTLPKVYTTLKHITPTHFMWATYDEVGKVTRTGGGSYAFNGMTLEETPTYGLGADFDVVKAKRQTFECKVEGKSLYLNGTLSNGRTLEEVWELVEKQ
jgi:hypothetical protein